MFSKESLYINAIKFSNQLKVNYKKLNNDEIIETNSSTFIATDDILGRDIATKLNNHASEINNTYISTLLIADDTILLRKKEVKLRDYVVTSLNNDYNIAVSKNTLFETRNYFEKCGIDYIFSAYHILNLHIEQNPCNNNLVVLLFNNQAFCIVVNDSGQIIYNKRFTLTAFEDIKQSKFYENEVLGQKLYDEVYALELEELVKNIIEEFYKQGKNIFIEKVSLLYNIRYLTEAQISQMSSDLMIDLTYHPISVDEELYELSKSTHSNKSFIRPRPKPTNTFRNMLITLVIFLFLFTVSLFILPYNKWLGIEKKIEKVEEKKVEKIKEIILPNHIKSNSIIEFKALEALETIPYDVVLREFILDRNNIILDVDMLKKDTFIKVIKPELKKSYENVDIKFKEENIILKALIKANKYHKEMKGNTFKNYKDVYISNEFMPIIAVTEQLKILFPTNTIINFKSSSKDKFNTFNYLINLVVKSPLEFFKLIDTLNNELYSINITYPVNFIKTEAGIEIEFTLQFNQPI
ncbi:hypothetical protein CP965_08020 [Halarcobacter mediterraneus]|uniref:Uncharacterized protein n=1 Tax=Halarcobacter mediterraneus TaxID=2023153 RepID=A0A4Q1AWP1_9BACT|nr:hypothetical protein [Halarcobacter mediterraneus]RXK12521.1 hypothetical protein CP965_08020 [Halarcobacter mediterraneus]